MAPGSPVVPSATSRHVIQDNDTRSGATDGNGICTNGDTQNSARDTSPDVSNEALKSNEGALPGSIGAIKPIYKSFEGSDDKWTWVDKCPEDVDEAAETRETSKFAIIVRNVKSQDSRKKFEAHSIILQSPWLMKALGEQVLKGYPGVACELSRVEFKAPFEPFLHRWGGLLRLMKGEDLDDTTKTHVNLLYDFLKGEIGDAINTFKDYVRKAVITFDHLWMLFQPGGIVVSDNDGPLVALELARSRYVQRQNEKFLRLECEYVDWTGEQFGRGTVSVDLPEFQGTEKIQMLDMFPLRFHENKEALKSQLIARGKKFESLADYNYKAYSGVAITWDSRGREQLVQVSGRIIIDTKAFNHFNPSRAQRVARMGANDLSMVSEYWKRHGNNDNDDNNNNDRIKGATKKISPRSDNRRIKLTPYHQMLCTPKLRGYSLKTKKWLDFFLEFVSDIKWNVNAFDSLVFPEDQKELIRAVSKSQVKNREVFDDVIQGKGKGIIILLSGAPGVGKTLTAEAIADDMHVPLHTITSGDLGSNSWEVESALSKVLDLVSQWNAILLLDECDVFLESRSTNDFKRNEIVSIFLRILEYYEGILFMTTNRADNIDTAFRSRIHISIEYPNLGTCARHQIWRNLLKTSTKPNELSYTDIDELAAVELNGRQIKNILKMAQLLANWKETALKRDFVNTVLALENRSQSAMDGFAPYSVRGLATSKKVALSIGFCIGVAVALAGLGIFGNFKHLI